MLNLLLPTRSDIWTEESEGECLLEKDGAKEGICYNPFMILPLVIFPDPRLKLKSKPVAKVDDETRKFLDDMLETMYQEGGIGLAAVQVGVLKRILVMDIERGSKRYGNEPDEAKSSPLFLINPEIIWASEELNSYEEGCLSLPQQYSEVLRPKEVKIRYTNYHGEVQEQHWDGLYATCVQHEIDHLDGIVFIDHISPVKRDIIARKLKKQKKLAGG